MSFPRKRESILGNDILDARFHGHDNTLLLLLEATVFQQALKKWVGPIKTIAAIDIGTNSVLYSLFHVVSSDKLREIHFRRHTPRIGQDFTDRQEPRLSEESYRLLHRILSSDLKHARKNGARTILIAATNPFRLAKNAKLIKQNLENDLSCEISILSASREAFLSFLGATGLGASGLRASGLRATGLGASGEIGGAQTGVIIDIGVGSTEIAAYQKGRRLAFVSIPEGAVSLTERFGCAGRVDSERLSLFETYLDKYERKIGRLAPYVGLGVTLVGGTSSSLAQLKNSRFLSSDRTAVLTRQDVARFTDDLSRQSLASRRRRLSFDKARAEIIFAGSFWLGYLYKKLGISKARATRRGLRHGLALDYLRRSFTA